MIRVVLFWVYLFSAALFVAILGLGDWNPYAQFGAGLAILITSTWFLPGYFYNGDPLPTRRNRTPGPPAE